MPKANAQTTFAIIGDYGSKGSDESAVANLVKSWKPEYILTLGDNNYPDGAESTIDGNIGKYYHSYIKSYKGSYGSGSDYGRFFPCIGNHDWSKKYGIKPYLNYFSLPGNERYYDFVKGSIHFFVLNSESHEPDGVSSTSKQAMWLKGKLKSSSAKWKVVYFHHSPYCSGSEAGSQAYMRWPFESWGADIVLSGHSHVYERFSRDGFPYLVNGLGGEHKASFSSRVSGSKVRYSSKFGAIKVTVKPDTLWFKFYNVSKTLIDSYPLVKKKRSGCSASIKPGGSTTLCQGEKVTLYANTCIGYTYQWKKDGKNITGAADEQYVASSSGSYQVKITEGSTELWSAPVKVTVNACGKKENTSGDTVITDRTEEKLREKSTHVQPIHDSAGSIKKNLVPVYSPNTFAVIGDYGSGNQNEAAVANLVKSWNPEYIITVGDNNYPEGAESTIDRNIGQFYHEYIRPYTGIYGIGADTNRFFPSLGNHDWMNSRARPYLNYFTLPGNERYYDFVKGNIHFFALDSDPAEPDGVSQTSTQAIWLKNKLANSVAKWKIVYFHSSPYCSDAVHGNQPNMQWPFKTWGADIVLTGHSHIYERLRIDDFTYLVNGLGGQSTYSLAAPIAGSQVRYNASFGAMKVIADPDTVWFSFYSASNTLIDNFSLVKGEPISIKTFSNDNSLIHVYPNPSTGLFTFEICLEDIKEEAIELKIIDTDGQLVYTKMIDSKNNCIKEVIELEGDLATGVYLLQLKFGDEPKSTKIVLKR